MAHRRNPAQRSVEFLLDLVRAAGYEEPSGFLEKGASACSEALEAVVAESSLISGIGVNAIEMSFRSAELAM